MDALRCKAQTLFKDQITSIAEALQADINAKKFYIRKDKSIHADVGVKKHILEILLNYNPLWLKIALECVFKTPIEKMAKRSEMHTLLHVLTTKLISFKELASKKGARNVVTYFMKEANVDAAKRHILYHFILIVHFLDVAKRSRLIDHDPCLFRTDSEYKSTRDILIAFSRDYITGVGDITKALRNVGIALEHQQLPIEQYNFTATKLSHDIRDGVRLARLAEFLLQRNDILSKLQFPPDSITRKIHNLELVFTIFRSHYPNRIPANVTAREVASGSRKFTFILLDKLIELYNEHQELLRLKLSEEFAVKIQSWYRRHLACKAQREYFIKLRAIIIWVQKSWLQKQLMKKDRAAFLAKKEATIKVQAIARGFLARKNFELLRARNNAALVLQRRFRANLLMKLERESFVKLRVATTLIQQRWRNKKKMEKDRAIFLAKKDATIKIQTFARGFLARKNFELLRERNKAALVLQRRFRANLQMKSERESFLQLKSATIWVQKQWRAKKQMQKDRATFLAKKEAIIKVQALVRGYLARKNYARHLEQLTNAALTVQRRFRANLQMKKEREVFVQLRSATIWVQKQWRAKKEAQAQRKAFLAKRQAIIAIQTCARAYLARKRYARLCEMNTAALILQRHFRANQQMRKGRAQFELMRRSAVSIQQYWRSYLLKKTARAHFLKFRQAVVFIQQKYREKRRANRFFHIVQEYCQLNQWAAMKITVCFTLLFFAILLMLFSLLNRPSFAAFAFASKCMTACLPWQCIVIELKLPILRQPKSSQLECECIISWIELANANR